ncbi:hypothetical protein FRC18_002041 [Serendipita sp. 400]|nr:hypothetical protein FRC18_002041 [Serendipita sp. 400]
MGTRNNSQSGNEEVQLQLLDSEGTTCTLPPLESIHSERLLEALQCDMCNQTLSDPVTLFCGHSVCISHIPTAALGVKGNSRDSNTSLETGTATNLSQSLSCPVSTCCNVSNENTITLPLNGVSLTVDGLFPIRYPANLGTNIRLGEIISLVKENENSHGQSHEPWPRDATQAILDLLTCGICLSTLEHPITTPFSTVNSAVAATSTSTTPRPSPKSPRLDTPIFVCQLSFPGMPTLLHIFEPRCVSRSGF